MASARRERRRGGLLGGSTALFLVVVAAVWFWRSREGSAARPAPPPPDLSLVTAPERPSAPPQPGQPRVRTRVPTPQMPAQDPVELAAVADAARAAGKPPGEAAFRRMIDKFIEYNIEFARAQAAKEGITVPEVAELTYLGYMVKATQSADELAQVTGRTYDEAAREQLGQLMRSHNDAFKEDLRALVARGAPEAERWALIHATEEAYKRDLFALTGLDADQFDGILAGDITRPGAPIATEYPEQVEPRPYVESAPRPGAAPR